MKLVKVAASLFLVTACSSGSPGGGDGGSRPDGGGGGPDASGESSLCDYRACGGDGAGGQCGTCEVGVCSEFGQCVRQETGLPAVVFVFDQDLKAILRLADGNGDGDMTDGGEATIFFDGSHPELPFYNSLGLLALDGDTLLAAHNAMDFESEPGYLLRLEDHNGDGDALDDGEASEFFDGSLPGGYQLHFPTGLRRGTDGAVYLSENNYIGDTNPEAIYRLVDQNGDGDVSDGGEVEVARLLEEQGQSELSTWESALDSQGYFYVKENSDSKDATRIFRIEEDGGLDAFLSGYELFPMTEGGENLVLAYTPGELGYLPHTDEIVTRADNYGGTVYAHLIAARDQDGSELIDTTSEFRILWDEGEDASEVEANAKDFDVLEDGSIVVIGIDNVLRLIDQNGDGDMNDEGEQILLLDGAASDLGATKTWRLDAVLL